MDPTAIALPLLAARIAARASQPSWILVIVAGDDISRVAAELADELEVLLPEGSVARGASDVEQALARAQGNVVVIAIDEAEASKLDLARSRLQHAQPVVLIATAAAAVNLGPHLRSWIGGSVFQLEAETSSKEARLAELRRAYGKTDDEIVAYASTRPGALEPHFAEWLALLGRGDLVRGGVPS